MTFTPGSRARLTAHDLPRFPNDTLFDHIAALQGRVTFLAEAIHRIPIAAGDAPDA